MISREEALALVEEKVHNVNLRRHMLATEAVMRAVSLGWISQNAGQIAE